MPMKSLSAAIALPLCLFLQGVCAQDGDRVGVLAEEMAVSKAYQDSISVCLEKAGQRDVEADVAKTPGLLGGIVPGDIDWPEAKALYARMLKAGCAYDSAQPIDAFTKALGETLSPAEVEALIVFYRSELGRRFVQASLVANNASYRAMVPSAEADGAYEAFASQLEALLARRKPAELPTSDQPRVAQAMASMDEAVAASDRMMKGIVAGQAREAIEVGMSHSTIPAETGAALLQQIEQHKPTIEDYGASVDYELVRNDTIHGSLIRTVYLHRFERHAMVWQFVWYRGKGGWVLSSLKYSADLPQLFQ